MSKKFNIKPPIWPKELTFEEFKNLNSHINESQIVSLYNQYLHKYLFNSDLSFFISPDTN